MACLVFLLACQVTPALPIETIKAAPVEAAMLVAPQLPEDVFLQYFLADSGEMHRVSLDGHYRYTAPGKTEETLPPKNRIEHGKEKLSNAAMARLIQAAQVLKSSSTSIGNGVRPVVFTARLEGKTWETRLSVNPGQAASYGPLEGLYRSLDNEVLGGWQNE